MSFKGYDWYSSLVVCFIYSFFFLFLVNLGFLVSFDSINQGVCWGSVFCFDSVSFYLFLLSGLLGAALLFFSGSLSIFSRFMISLSLISSFLCYSCVHVLWFWVFYELSILPLLVLLFLESPYSERYVAGWYLLGYVVLTSLPMVLCFLYLSLSFGSFLIGSWACGESLSVGVYLLFAILFITKIPLPPFHVWLPIVHAEASSSVSVCLSGYIMKLGILGVSRFCYLVLPDFVFCNTYMFLVLGASVLFFLSSCRELDGKRWLAFLSLSHIVVACVCLSVCSFSHAGLSFLYCLGHGLSAGVIFLFLWLIYDFSGSRNWGILKFGLSGSLVIRCLCVVSLCTACSLPPTLQFFSEVGVLQESGFSSWLYVLGFLFYLFFGGLVPLFLVGCLLSRHYSVSVSGFSIFSFLCSIVLLSVWSFALFTLC